MKETIAIVLLSLLSCSTELQPENEISESGSNTIDHNCTDIHSIPDQWIDAAKGSLNIVYFRASHGSQLTDGGMSALVNFSEEYSTKYAYGNQESGVLTIEEAEADLQHQNDSWVSTTEEYLNSHPNCNTVMWAWCKIYQDGIDVEKYIQDMELLISKHGPGGSAGREVPVTFVFMNGHTYPWAGDGLGERAYMRNKRVRDYCQENGFWFYDFYDIECYDPDGNYFGDGNPDGSYSGENRLRWDSSYDAPGGGRANWAIDWMERNPDSELAKLAQDQICVSCEHSEGRHDDGNARLQCVLKGNATWWLWARLAGWEGVE